MTLIPQGFPIIFCLMGRKTQAAYTAVFEIVAKIAPNLKPIVVISDFELGLMNSAEMTFMNKKMQGCWFHYIYVRRKV